MMELIQAATTDAGGNGGGGVGTTQLVAVIGALFTALLGSFGYIRALYAGRLEDQRTTMEARLRDKDAAIAERDQRLSRFEDERKDRMALQERTVQALETSVEVNRQQGQTLDAISDKLSSAGTRSPRARSGD